MLQSSYSQMSVVSFPEFKGRDMYMHTLDLSFAVMPEGYEDYLQPVLKLCSKANRTSGLVHITIDEKRVEKGMSQRRPGAHVDGCFMKTFWGHPDWLHYCNNIPFSRMSVIVASSIPGCIAYPGNFAGTPKNDGDLEHIRGQLPLGDLLPANTGFLLSPDCVHESKIFNEPVNRQFLRIALENH